MNYDYNIGDYVSFKINYNKVINKGIELKYRIVDGCIRSGKDKEGYYEVIDNFKGDVYKVKEDKIIK